MKTSYSEIEHFQTKDGSEIRELMHPTVHGNRNQSLAEAIVYPGQKTRLHRHRLTEEIYHVTQGNGTMTLEGEVFAVTAGDTVCIAAGSSHCIENSGAIPLKFICACSPPYSDGDTQLL